MEIHGTEGIASFIPSFSSFFLQLCPLATMVVIKTETTHSLNMHHICQFKSTCLGMTYTTLQTAISSCLQDMTTLIAKLSTSTTVLRNTPFFQTYGENLLAFLSSLYPSPNPISHVLTYSCEVTFIKIFPCSRTFGDDLFLTVIRPSLQFPSFQYFKYFGLALSN